MRTEAYEGLRDLVLGGLLIASSLFFFGWLATEAAWIGVLLGAILLVGVGYTTLWVMRLSFDYLSSRGTPRSRIDESELQKRRYAELMAWNEELADWSRRLKQATGLSYEEWLIEERARIRFRGEIEHYRRVADHGPKSIDTR